MDSLITNNNRITTTGTEISRTPATSFLLQPLLTGIPVK
jgi:hypothetical protein